MNTYEVTIGGFCDELTTLDVERRRVQAESLVGAMNKTLRWTWRNVTEFDGKAVRREITAVRRVE